VGNTKWPNHTSRRKRFLAQFDKQLAEIGWEPSGRYIYRKKAE
jgi:hypothetical protein